MVFSVDDGVRVSAIVSPGEGADGEIDLLTPPVGLGVGAGVGELVGVGVVGTGVGDPVGVGEDVGLGVGVGVGVTVVVTGVGEKVGVGDGVGAGGAPAGLKNCTRSFPESLTKTYP